MGVVGRLGGETSSAKVGVASAIGATIEWYDFFLYGTAAGSIFNQLFFPEGNPTASTLAAYATFAAGFVPEVLEEASRPVTHSLENNAWVQDLLVDSRRNV